MTKPTLVWFRQDLRVADQAALAVAAAAGPVVAAYVLDDESAGDWAIGGAQRWWLHHSLEALAADLKALGVPLVLRRGESAAALAAIAEEAGVVRVHALRHYEPWWKNAEARVAAMFDLHLHDGNYLAPPASVRTGSGGRYRIFTPYWRALQAQMPPPAPSPVPQCTGGPAVHSDALEDWGLLPTAPDWSEGFDVWTPGSKGAHAALAAFEGRVHAYQVARNLPSQPGSSRLSPHLHFGEISPAEVWHTISAAAGDAAEPFLRELGWRDFTTNTIDQFGSYGTDAGRAQHDALKIRTGAEADREFKAWTKGQTGCPIVDAGMREMWATGWMHNRVRMITASFLVKHLLIDWRRGKRWFWDTLVDADYGNNAVNWQWISGSGVDSSLFTRIMAPLSQSEKFASGDYIRRWVPELATLDDASIHDPHGVGVAPKGYARPLIGHREGRERALAAYRATR